tara:strand:+ start:985 stop:1335 length:351 start_codon:yes stop_codon:yes gene_type:complete
MLQSSLSALVENGRNGCLGREVGAGFNRGWKAIQQWVWEWRSFHRAKSRSVGVVGRAFLLSLCLMQLAPDSMDISALNHLMAPWVGLESSMGCQPWLSTPQGMAKWLEAEVRWIDA